MTYCGIGSLCKSNDACAGDSLNMTDCAPMTSPPVTLPTSTPGTTRSVADVLALMNAAGGGDAGRAAAVAAMAQDPATTANLAAKGVFISGINAALEVPGFGTLFGPLPGG